MRRQSVSAKPTRVKKYMNDVEQLPQSWVFNRESLETALAQWKAAQLEAYPHQEKLISTTTLAMVDFLESEYVKNNKMTM